MSVARARIIKASEHEHARAGASSTVVAERAHLARRIPAVVVDAQAQAARIVEEANAKAHAVAESAATEAREREVARIAAELLQARADEERRAEREIDHTIQLATALAERLIGGTLELAPARVQGLAVEALQETRGARQLRIEASAADIPALTELIASLGEGVASIEPSAELSRGSLIVHTELGRVDARLAPQLDRLAEALREVLRARDTAP